MSAEFPRRPQTHLDGVDPPNVHGEPGGDPDAGEGAPAVRVRRSRMALALAITLAALPLLVIDNLPATAETEDVRVATVAPARGLAASSTTTTMPTPSTTVTTVTTVAPAPPTTAATAPVRARVAAPPTTVAAPPAPTTTTPPATGGPADPNDPANWDRMAQCEAGGNWGINSGNGYYGGLQFSLSVWTDTGGVGYPHEASREEQIKRGMILQARGGWAQWPTCARSLGFL